MADLYRQGRDEYGFGQDFASTDTRTRAAPPAQGWGVPFSQTGGRDAYGNPIRTMVPDPAAAPVVPANPYYPQFPATPLETPAPVTPAGPAAFAGSPLNTMYGIDSESYLTEDQRKLARQIQGKFDASLNRRDRELAQYGAPRLASFVEDEALARAMSLARGLNIPVQDALGMVQGSGPASRGSTGGGGGGSGGGGSVPRTTTTTTPRVPADPREAVARTAPPGASPAQKQDWGKLLLGISSYIPTLFGKDGMEIFGNKGLAGLFQAGYKKIFGADAPPAVQGEFVKMAEGTSNITVPEQGFGMDVPPLASETGYPYVEGWGNQPIEPYTGGDVPWWEGGDYGNTYIPPETIGFDETFGDAPDWWTNFDDGGWWAGNEFIPDAGWFSAADPYGIGGW